MCLNGLIRKSCTESPARPGYRLPQIAARESAPAVGADGGGIRNAAAKPLQLGLCAFNCESVRTLGVGQKWSPMPKVTTARVASTPVVVGSAPLIVSKPRDPPIRNP